MKRIGIKILLGTTMALLMTTTAFAGSWEKDSNGWWYATNDSKTEWLSHGWHWVDGNKDGSAECYWFDENGYMVENFISADGFICNADGAWVVNGVVQTKQVDIETTNENTSETGSGWKQDAHGWWYATNNAGTEWLSDGWHWVDADNDGVAYCYWFDANGYMAANTTIHSATVNADGAWVVNGVVQTKNLNQSAETTTAESKDEVSESKNTYNKYGVSNIALDMMKSTREENDAKYEIEKVKEISSVITSVYYTNGFYVYYAEPSSGTYKRVGVTDNEFSRLFKYYDANIPSPEEAEEYLLDMGLWTYGWGDNGKVASDNIACFIGVGTETIMWSQFGTFSWYPSSLHLR